MTTAARRRRGDLFMAAAMLGLALLLGGGSPLAPLFRMVVELAGVVTLGWFLARGWHAPGGRAATVALWLIALIVLLIVIQTIPLPPGIWRGLPGRDTAAHVLDVVGDHGAWLPLSLDPSATREAGYFLVPAIAMFVATLHLDRPGQSRLLALIVLGGVASALLVMVQARGMMWLTFYDTAHSGKGQGLFANKNHNAALLVLSIPLAALLGPRLAWFRTPRNGLVAAAIAILILTLGVLGCLSRAGLALLPVALLVCIPLLGGWGAIRRHPWWSAAAVAAIIIGVLLLIRSTIATEMLDRFGADQEGRFTFWPDVIFAIRQFLPWGSGLGTFVPVFQINESLDAVSVTYTNHAPRDYLEIALETGIPGLLILASGLGWIAATGASRLRAARVGSDFATLLAVTVGIVVLLAASVVDYPLRTLSLSCALAVLTAILASPIGGRLLTEDTDTAHAAAPPRP